MNKEEVEKLISQKSKPTQEMYNALYETTYSHWKDDYCEDFLAMFTYNCIIIWIADILNYPQYYVSEIYEINEEDIDIIRKDYDSMESLDYPDEYSYIDPTALELEIEERFMTARCKDSESDAE